MRVGRRRDTVPRMPHLLEAVVLGLRSAMLGLRQGCLRRVRGSVLQGLHGTCLLPQMQGTVLREVRRRVRLQCRYHERWTNSVGIQRAINENQ